MTEQAPEKIFSGINIPKVLAGALAAVCAAVVGSFLGVAGTLIGAAVASIVGSVGTEVYERSLQRGAKKLQTLAPVFVKAPAAVGTPEVAAATEEDSPSHTVAGTTYQRKIRWGHIAAAAAGVFILAMGSITLYEWIAGEPLAAAVGASSDKGTTVGNKLGNNKSSDQEPAPATSTTSVDRQPNGDVTTTPTTDATPTAPTSQEPTTAPTTADPTGDTPQSTTDPGSGDGDSGSGGNLDSGSGGGAGDGSSSGSSDSGSDYSGGSGGSVPADDLEAS